MQEQRFGCLICGKDLVYNTESEEMKCSIYGNEFPSNARCLAGHYMTCSISRMNKECRKNECQY